MILVFEQASQGMSLGPIEREANALLFRDFFVSCSCNILLSCCAAGLLNRILTTKMKL